MNYREVVNNIISDAKLLTKMTARQSSIFRRKIYSRINDATETEEVHKEIPYPNKKRKIIDKDQNIGALLVMYKGLMEKYTSFTNRSKDLQRKNCALEAALKRTNNSSYYKNIIIIYYQFLVTILLVSILWIDGDEVKKFQAKYKQHKKFCTELVVLWFVFILENYLSPIFHFVVEWLTNLFVFIMENIVIPLYNFIFPCHNTLYALAY
jgi:hypothetical protein